MDLAGRERAFERVAVGVAEHEHAAIVGMLHDQRQQAVALAPIGRVDVEGCRNHGRTTMPRVAR